MAPIPVQSIWIVPIGYVASKPKLAIVAMMVIKEGVSRVKPFGAPGSHDAPAVKQGHQQL